MLLCRVLVHILRKEARKEASDESHAVHIAWRGHPNESLKKFVGKCITVTIEHVIIAALEAVTHF